MGCGKSSVGRELSRLLCCPFMDLDAVIEERAGRSVPEIFAADGEAGFRQMELDVLANIVAQPVDYVGPHLRFAQVPPSRGWQNANSVHQADAPGVSSTSVRIVALGGCSVMTPKCAEIVHEQTLCIYLKASIETLLSHLEGQTDNRPVLNTTSCHSDRAKRVEESALRNRINDLMALRSATYEKTAHIIIDTDGKSIEAIASEIKGLIL